MAPGLLRVQVRGSGSSQMTPELSEGVLKTARSALGGPCETDLRLDVDARKVLRRA